MRDKELDSAKDRLIEAMTDAYSRGAMEDSSFERAVTRITASEDLEVLASEASALGLSLARPEARAGAQPEARREPRSGSHEYEADLAEIVCVSGRIREEGEWVRAERYRLCLKSSSARLDLRGYEGRRGFRLFLELDMVSSSLRLELPEGFELSDRIAERRSSTLRNEPRSALYDDCIVELSGSIASSRIKVKYR